MPPADMESIPCQLEASSFKTFDKAMELPILHDAFTIASKLHEQATHFPTYNQVETIVSNGIQLLDAELSEEIKTGVARAVLSVDCLISSGLDKLTATVPSLAKPTDKIFPSLKLADYILAFFGLSIHQRGPEQESQNHAMGVVQETEESQDEEELILSSDRCPGIETLSKEECRLCSSSMLLCSNLPHLPYVSKENKEFQDEALEVTKETLYEDLEVTQETQDRDLEVTTATQVEDLKVTKETQDVDLKVTTETQDEDFEVTKEHQESQDEALDVIKETQESEYEALDVTKESQDEATEVTGETQESRDEVTEVATEVPVEIKEYNEIMKDTEETQNEATEATVGTPKFFKETEETQKVITQVSQKDVLEVTEFIEVVDVIGAFEVVDVVESIEFIQVIDD